MRYLAVCLVGAALTIVALEVANYCADQYAAPGVAPGGRWTTRRTPRSSPSPPCAGPGCSRCGPYCGS